MDRPPHMTPGGTDDASGARDGWRLVQLAQLAGDIEQLARNVRESLADFEPHELHGLDGAVLSPDRRDAALNDICALRDAAEQMGIIGGDFTPHDDALSVPLAAIGEAAAKVMAEGSANVAMIQLAARMLDCDDGYAALAEGIETDPSGHVGQWGEATISEVLGAFHDADEGRTAWICASARISPEALWTSLDAGVLAQIAWALRNAPRR